MNDRFKFKMSHKGLAVFLLVALGISLIPILYLSGYVHATGDDYGYGYRTHHVWLDTHNLWQVIVTAAQTAKAYWGSWQGTWFTIFLMALQPEVFSPNAYWIVPWIMLFVTFTTTSLVVYDFVISRLGLDFTTFACVDILLLIAMVHFFPSTKSGIFWYNGTVHYIVPYGLAMVAVYCILKFADCPRVIWFLGTLFCMICLGGSSYLAAMFVPIILVYIWICCGKRKKHVFGLMIPLVAECIGLYISFISPGNKTRGGESFGFQIDKIVGTIFLCFAEGAKTAVTYFMEKPVAIILIFFAALLLYDGFRKQEKMVYSFKFPGLFAGVMFATWCALFAPELYAGVEVSGGVPNTYWQFFLLTFLAVLLYFAGWFAYRQKSKCEYKITKHCRMYALIVTICFAGIIFGRSTIKDTTFYVCYRYISSGEADDYKRQMEERLMILLDDSIHEAELPAMNSEQGPFMHMEVLPDPEGWTNSVVKDFYRKERVVEIPRQ